MDQEINKRLEYIEKQLQRLPEIHGSIDAISSHLINLNRIIKDFMNQERQIQKGEKIMITIITEAGYYRTRQDIGDALDELAEQYPNGGIDDCGDFLPLSGHTVGSAIGPVIDAALLTLSERDRVIVWDSEMASINDAGENSVAEIVDR